MESNFEFIVDKVIKGKGYPALARHVAEPYTQSWREFGQHWPYTVPVELHEHCSTHNFSYRLMDQQGLGSQKSWYPIGLGFFNFGIDYFGLLPQYIKESLIQRRLRVLFYYHEGDNPYTIKQRLDSLCLRHGLPVDCYHFISGNTRADDIKGFSWFPDHELLYWHRNRNIPACTIDHHDRPFQFTALNRTHKWWRATAMADLWRSGLLDASQWSYRTDIECGDQPEDNPIEIDEFQNLRLDLDRFLSQCPHVCDDMDVGSQNDHHLIEPRHYTSSWCSIIFETHFDADASSGAFLTEKTFKAIKHGHPFIIVGCAGSLKALRDLGYKTFDHALDNSYDDELNNTHRWRAIKQTIGRLAQQNLPSWFESVKQDIIHNQNLFLSSKYDRLNTLFKKLHQT